MGRVYYLKFLGARVYEEKGSLAEDQPLIVVHDSKVFDCNESAWNYGIRPKDTLRQAKMTCPFIQTCFINDPNGKNLTHILNDFLALTPLVEPHGENGVFLDLEDASKGNLPTYLTKMLRNSSYYFFTSVGIGETKVLARIASTWAMQKHIKGAKFPYGKKEWGYSVCDEKYIAVNVFEDKGQNYLRSLPVFYLLDDMSSISSDVLSSLYSLGLKTFGDIQKIPLHSLIQALGDQAHLIKALSQGKDFSHVKAFYAPHSIAKTITGDCPLSSISLSLIEENLREIWEPLKEQGLGFSIVEVTLSGNFPSVQAQKKLLYTVSHFETAKNISALLLDQIVKVISGGGRGNQEYLVSSITISVSGIQKVSAKANMLFQEPLEKMKDNLESLPFKKTYLDIRKKYGEKALGIGISRDLRREQMLNLWDPIRLKSTLDQDVASN